MVFLFGSSVMGLSWYAFGGPSCVEVWAKNWSITSLVRPGVRGALRSNQQDFCVASLPYGWLSNWDSKEPATTRTRLETKLSQTRAIAL